MRPKRRAVPFFNPKREPTIDAITALRVVIPRTRAAINPGLEPIKSRSISKPTEKKKSPTKIPRKGAISASMWCLCFVSDKRIPAKNAPSVFDRPSPSVRKDIPRTDAKMAPTNASWLLVLATLSKKGFNKNLPIKAMILKAIAAFNPADPRASRRPPPPPARIGVTTKSGTTARSCRSKTPKEDLPKVVLISSFSLRSCNTKAELDRAKPPPKTICAAVESPKPNLQMAATKAAVIRNWLPPSPNTSRLILISVLKSKWIPISNRKKTIPISANSSVVWISFTRLIPFGPNKSPRNRYPRIGEAPIILERGVLSAVVNNNSIVSALGPCMYDDRPFRADRTARRGPAASSVTTGEAISASPPRGTVAQDGLVL
mmetsp:Transcript_2501/g.6023  ORF Transcript_2501/g.6023 Transcript_2501/m.6023 type:complete len:374 (-) Transcript_2501:258-1379(-)